MNFLAHGWRYLDTPYLLAGTAVPDWLGFIDRRIRARRRLAEPYVTDVDPRVAEVARGVVQHHVDDDRFHRCEAFQQLSWQFTAEIRDALAPDDGMRPSFLGHILVELLLDASLSKNSLGRLDQYYQCLRDLHPEILQAAVNRMTTRPTDKIGPLVPRFIEEGFLYDYLDDRRLLLRVNQLLKRVRLDQVPDSILQVFARARDAVERRTSELMAATADR